MKIFSQAHQVKCSDELSSLINNYHLGDVEIGMISFFDKYLVKGKCLFFGEIDMDLLGFNISNREIILVDHANIDFVMLKCSKNSDAFISLLMHYSEFVLNDILKQPENFSIDVSKIYAEVGGVEYKRFVDFLFGIN